MCGVNSLYANCRLRAGSCNTCRPVETFAAETEILHGTFYMEVYTMPKCCIAIGYPGHDCKTQSRRLIHVISYVGGRHNMPPPPAS